MVFSSIIFIVYFLPILLFFYFVLPHKFKNGYLAFASILFYIWGAPKFTPILLLSCTVDYFITRYVSRGRISSKWIYVAIVGNVGLLFYFKYINFFFDNLNSIMGGNGINWEYVILPIGISFLVFEKISYLVDVSRNDYKAQDSFINYLLFVLLFPHSIAGPIVRYKELAAQLTDRFEDRYNNLYLGLVRFVIGLSKKVLIANVLAEKADLIFKSEHLISNPAMAWLGILSYTFQLYFDFAGYSDMAIGIGRMLGFTIPENFNFPYSSKSITEFWQKWHMTLGSWMKDYLYIPLGGNRLTDRRTYVNLFIVFFISGLWHGASWNFVIWGMYHGLFLVIERSFLLNFLSKMHVAIRMIYTFLVIVGGWVFFRVESLSEACAYFGKMCTVQHLNTEDFYVFDHKYWFVLIIAALTIVWSKSVQEKLESIYKNICPKPLMDWGIKLLVLCLYLLNLGELFVTGFNPFIYFKF